MSLTASLMKQLKTASIHTRCTVFGYIRQTVINVFGESKFTDAFSFIQFICLSYYWEKDEWDSSQLATGLTLKNNTITKIEGDVGRWTTHYKSAFLKNICDNGRYQWKFKIHKITKIWCLIGIWKIRDAILPIHTYFTSGHNIAYAMLLEAGKLVSLRGGGNFESEHEYCDKCKPNDIVEMFLDLDKLEISYGINGKHFGKAFTVTKAKYRAAICLQGKDSAIELLN
eukprot:429783_1